MNKYFVEPETRAHLAEFFAHLRADDTPKRLEASVDALHPLSLVAVGDLSPIPTIRVIVSAMPEQIKNAPHYK